MKKKSFTIGLDLGGTKLASALLDDDGNIIDFIKIPVEMSKEGSPLKTQKRVLNLMSDICHDFKKRYPKETEGKYFKGVALAILCYDLSIGFHLDGIFLSGGLIKIKDLYLENLKSNYTELITNFNPNFRTKITPAKTGNHAGVIGAGYLPYLH